MTKEVPNEIPAGGSYQVVDPLTKVLCMATSLEGLVRRVGQVRSAMGAHTGTDLRAEVESWLCGDYPQDRVPVDVAKPRKRSRLLLSDVVHGTQAMIARFISGHSVPREEAERRAQICMKCPLNTVFDKPCTGVCGTLLEIAMLASGRQGTQYDRYLHSCSICGCFLQAAIWCDLESQCKGVTPTMVAQFATLDYCWKKCG
jgi:hypothetical protein